MCFMNAMTWHKFLEITQLQDLAVNADLMFLIQVTLTKAEKLDGLGWYLEHEQVVMSTEPTLATGMF